MKRYSTINVDKILVIILTLFVITLGFVISDIKGRLMDYEHKENQVDSLLSGSGAVAGFTCGALSESKAEELLETDVRVGYDQRPTDIIQSTKPRQSKLFWTDSCRYESTENSSKYIELYVSTFSAIDLAADAFPDFFKTVNDNEEQSADTYGQRVVYDGGIWYLLRNNTVVRVSASNGNPSETKEFSYDIFKTLAKSLL